ncbi:MAG TPA: heme-binding domain-containing protein [Bacteroidota bacterium]|nr:heme-binding domain-containing protein [Bacteroidota bacterium]
MKILKPILLVLACLFIVLQFFRPPRNSAGEGPAEDITTTHEVPQLVQDILQRSCYDCHSSSTEYPWYAQVQPVGWWLYSHISDAKEELNFSEFALYGVRRQYIKLQQIAERVADNEMPLPSYLLLHADAELSPDQKKMLITWADTARDSMKSRYPPDSLLRGNKPAGS